MVWIEGVVRWYCYDAKPFNLTACFITKCDPKCYNYVHQHDGPWIAVYNNVRTLVTFSSHTMLVLIGEKSIICSRTELNGQSKTFARMLATGHH